MQTRIIKIGSRRLLQIERRRDLVQIVGLFSILVPIWIFLADGGLADFEPSDFLSVSNRLSALMGTSLLLLHLALVARIPWVERTIGLDKLTSSHKKLGKPLLAILVIHSALAVASYADISSISWFSALGSLSFGYFEVLLAVISIFLMVAVVFSSIRAARKRLSYESWYLIHLISYVAILLAIPHQLNLGTDFLGQPLMQSWYTLLYIFVFGNIVWFRVMQPVVMSLASGLRITHATPGRNNTTSLVIGGKNVERFNAQAGQFFLVRVLNKQQWWRPHPFSVSNSPRSEIRFTIGNRGDDTSLMQKLAIGTRVVLEGPFGVFTEQKRTKQHVTLIAAGIGVAPIRALAESLAAEPGDITIIYRTTDIADSALLDEVEQLSLERGHDLHVLTGQRGAEGGFMPQEANGKPEHVRLLQLSPHILDSDVYVCGPSNWSDAVKSALLKLRIPKHQIHIEEFAW